MVNILYTISTAYGTKVALLEDMIVNKNFRGQGVGSSLIKFVLKKLKKQGCTRVTLLTDEDNIKAHHFYKKQGFTKSSMVVFRKKLIS